MGRTAEDSGKEQTWHHSRRGWTGAKISGEVETRYRCHYTRSFLQRSVVFGEQSCNVFVVPHNHGTKLDPKVCLFRQEWWWFQALRYVKNCAQNNKWTKTLQIVLLLFEKLILWNQLWCVFSLIYLIFSKTLVNLPDPLGLISTCYQSGLEVILVKVSWYLYWMTVSIRFPSKLTESAETVS